MSKKTLRHFERERLIWEAHIEAKHKLILLAYNSYLGSNDTCWPSNHAIALMTGIPKSTLIRDLQAMRQQSIITSTPRFLKNKRRLPDKEPAKSKPQDTNLTTIDWTQLEALSIKPLKVPQSQNETTPQSQNETTPQSQNETTPVPKRDYPSPKMRPDLIHGSNSGSDPERNNPPYPPKGDGGIANATQEQEVDRANETMATKSNSVKQSNPEKGQSSAPPRSPEIRAVRKFYPESPPPWRWGYGVNEYHKGFVGFVRQLLREMPETSAMKALSAEGLIAHYETPKGFANLEARCKQWMDSSPPPNQPACVPLVPTIPQPVPPPDPLEQHLAHLGWSKTRAIQHMIEHHGWPDILTQTGTLRGGKIFNWQAIGAGAPVGARAEQLHSAIAALIPTDQGDLIAKYEATLLRAGMSKREAIAHMVEIGLWDKACSPEALTDNEINQIIDAVRVIRSVKT
jgi:hypothetical protein